MANRCHALICLGILSNCMNKTIKNYINDYLRYCQTEKGLSQNTSKTYSRLLDDLPFEYKTPEQITNEDIMDYRAYLDNQNFSKSTQSYYLIVLRGFLKFLSEKDIKSLSPEKIKLPKLSDREIKIITTDEFRKLITQINPNTTRRIRNRAILEVFSSTGLRLSELVSLDKKHFENVIEDLELSIKGKGGKIRFVYFPPQCIEWIKKYLNKRKDNYPALFVTSSGRIKNRSVQAMITRYSKQIGLEITAHSLRHLFAITLLRSGANLRIAQLLLGHSSSKTTEIYTNYSNLELKEAVKKSWIT